MNNAVRVGGVEPVVYNGPMRALVKTSAQPGLTAIDRPDPKPGPTDAIIRVAATSLCGTDAHIYNWDPWAHSRIHPPRIIGHEMCGEVVEVGSNVTLVKVGDYVAAESHITCGHCFQCRTGQAHVCKNYRILGVDRDGSFAEYVSLPEAVLWKTSPSPFTRTRLPPRTARQRRRRRLSRRPHRTDGLDHRLWSDRTLRGRRRTNGRCRHDYRHGCQCLPPGPCQTGRRRSSAQCQDRVSGPDRSRHSRHHRRRRRRRLARNVGEPDRTASSFQRRKERRARDTLRHSDRPDHLRPGRMKLFLKGFASTALQAADSSQPGIAWPVSSRPDSISGR